jgi:two-component system response regulator CpxR
MTVEAAVPAEGCVLVVDDDEGIRDTLSELVQLAGCSAICAANGAEALKVLAKCRPCLIILDLLMPVMSGQELLEALRLQPALASVPVVISTSAPHHAPAGVPIIPKPINIATVFDWMRRTCRCTVPLPSA